MTYDQKKYLRGRIAVATERLERKLSRVRIQKPESVKAAKRQERQAQRVLARWWETERRAKERVSTVISRKRRTVDEAMIFGDAKKALAAVKRFERFGT